MTKRGASFFLARMSSSSAINEIEFKKINNIGCILLNRPKQLNALNLPMVIEMKKKIEQCENDKDIKVILVKGAGDVAYCAGGDVKSIRDLCLKGDHKTAMDFFGQEYQLNYKIANCKKPYIALINGITMGGGVGVSVHGRYRIATEKTLFAMPETAIGFFADVGGSYFLSRLRDKIGIYLVLTGNRLKGQDVKLTGIATHFVNSNNLASLENALYETNNLNLPKLEEILNKFNENLTTQFDTTKILRNFNESSLEAIIGNLEKENSDWSKQQLKLINKMSPTSLKVAIKQLELGAKMSLRECLQMEYQLCLRFTKANDFSEGVRALLVDKGDKPKWKPATYQEVSKEIVDWYFKPLEDDDKLVLEN